MLLRPKNYIAFLALQVLTVPLVISIFKVIEPRNVAATLAGSLFVGLGFYIYKTSIRSRSSLSLYFSFLHLFIFALPMLVRRIFYWNSSFEDIVIFGIPGPYFHRASEVFFVMLVLATLIDLVRSRFINKPKERL